MKDGEGVLEFIWSDDNQCRSHSQSHSTHTLYGRHLSDHRLLVNIPGLWGSSSHSNIESKPVQVQRREIDMISLKRDGRNCSAAPPCYASVLLCVQCISSPDYISCGADMTIYCGSRLKKHSFLHPFLSFWAFFNVCHFYRRKNIYRKTLDVSFQSRRFYAASDWVATLRPCMQSDQSIPRWKPCADESRKRVQGSSSLDWCRLCMWLYFEKCYPGVPELNVE